MTTMNTDTGAYQRLTAEQRRRLDNICASAAMEGQRPTDAEREILAAYLLDELTAEQVDAQMDALDE